MTFIASKLFHFTVILFISISISSVSGGLSDLLSRLTRNFIDKDRPIVLILDKDPQHSILSATPAPPAVKLRNPLKPKVSNNEDIETILKDLLKLQKKSKSLILKSNRKISRSKSDRSRYDSNRSSFRSSYDNSKLNSRLRSSYNSDRNLKSDVQSLNNIVITEKVKDTVNNMKGLGNKSPIVKSLLVLRNRLSCNARDECQDKCENKRKRDQCEDMCEVKHECEPEPEDPCEDDECAPSDDSCEDGDCSGSTRAPPLPEVVPYCPQC